MILNTVRSHSSLLTAILLSLIVGLGLVLYASHTQDVPAGWDPVAYLHAGRRIAEGGGPTFCHPLNEQIGPFFTLAGFNVNAESGPCLALTYPPGFPILLAAAQLVTAEPDAALAIPALMGGLGIVATYGLGAVLFDTWVGLVAAFAIALMPTVLVFSTSPWSDLAGSVFTTACIALFVWAHSVSQTRPKWSRAAVVLSAGVFTCGLFIRYGNIIALIPMVLYVMSTQKGGAFKSTTNLLFAATVGLGIAALLQFNRVYYGGYLTTGYSVQHGWYAWPAFSLRYAFGPSPAGGKSLLAGLNTIAENLGWLLLPGALGLVAMTRSKAALLAGLIVSFVGFYGLYAFAPEDINARFLLPVFPALAVAVSYGLKSGAMRWGQRNARWFWAAVSASFLVVAVFLPLPNRLKALNARNGVSNRTIADVRLLLASSQPDAVFLAYNLNDAIHYYGERTSFYYRRVPPFDPVTGSYRWDQWESLLAEAVNQLLQQGLPVYYVQDSDPPFANSLELLSRHFHLQPLGSAPRVFRIERSSLAP